jgi:hypothetical protein
MFDDPKHFEVTAKDLELIEAALQTQKKILSVQSEAGTTAARERLADVNRLMKRVTRFAPGKADRAPKASGWAQLARTLFCAGGDPTRIR